MGQASIDILVDGNRRHIVAQYNDEHTDGTISGGVVNGEFTGEARRGMDAVKMALGKLEVHDSLVIPGGSQVKLEEHVPASVERCRLVMHCDVPGRDVNRLIAVNQANWQSSVIQLLRDNFREPLQGGALTPADLDRFRAHPNDPGSQFLLCLGTAQNAGEFTDCVRQKLVDISRHHGVSSGVVDEALEQRWVADDRTEFPIQLPVREGRLIAADSDYDDTMTHILLRVPNQALAHSLDDMFAVTSDAIRLSSRPNWINEQKILGDRSINEEAFRQDPNNGDATKMTAMKLDIVRQLVNKYFKKIHRNVTLDKADAAHLVAVYYNMVVLRDWAEHGVPRPPVARGGR